MDVRVRCCGLGNHYAADGSHIDKSVVEAYLQSKDYKLSIDGKLTLGYLTHRGRSIEFLPDSIGSSGLKKVIGRDDAGLCVGENLPTFTHYVKEFYIEDVPGEGPFLMALVHIFDENAGFDHIAAENIRRLKSLIRAGVRLTCSLVVLAYWSNEGTGGVDECKKIKSIKSLDWTINPSFGPLARITEVIDDEEQKQELTKTFSEIENDKEFIKSQPKEGEVKVKVFSDLNALGFSDVAKTSKINGRFCTLKAKEYSSVYSIVSTEEQPTEKLASEVEPQANADEQKEFSVTTLKERIRYSKFSTRMRFRRLIIEYKQVVKQMGGVEKIDPDTLKKMKSLFMADIMEMMSAVTSEITGSGKQINTILGCSAFSKELRVAAQKLQIPYRLAFQELGKTGKLSPVRFQKLKEAYMEFAKAVQDEVFSGSPIPEDLEKEVEQEEKENG